MRITRRVVTASLLAMALSAPAFADDKPTHSALGSGPELSVLRPHDEGASRPRRPSRASSTIESDGQVSSPKQTADIEAALAKGVKGIVISPERGRRHGAGAAGGGRREGPGRDRRPARALGRRASSAMSAPTMSRAARRRAI